MWNLAVFKEPGEADRLSYICIHDIFDNSVKILCNVFCPYFPLSAALDCSQLRLTSLRPPSSGSSLS